MEDRQNLKHLQICRFCLTETEQLMTIYDRTDGSKGTISLPLQIMACLSIEAYKNDGMPELICTNCQTQIDNCYNFKTQCRSSDEALRLYMMTGRLVKPKHSRQHAIQSTSIASSVGKRTFSLDSIESDKGDNEIPLHSNHQTDGPHDEPNQILHEEDGNHLHEEGNHQHAEDDNFLHEDAGVTNVATVATDVFPCTDCERSFPLEQLLELHQRIHNRERNFLCEKCNKKFLTKYDLAKHFQTHSVSKPFECVVCNKTFARESFLHRHEQTHVDVPKYLCCECDKTFFKKDTLDYHVQTKHKKKRPFVCRICKRSFVFKQGLERHEALHTDERPHKCNYCDASYSTPIKLMRHITTHAGLRPYPCKICGRTFLLSHHLTRHIRSHYATKSGDVEPVGQHKCDVCSMSFRRKDSLINHSAIHSMVNLKCVICYTEFGTAKEVKEHITTHLAGLPYPCDKCDYSFESQDQLEEHEMKHAEMEYEEQIEKEFSKEVKKVDQKEQEPAADEETSEFAINDETDVTEIGGSSQIYENEILIEDDDPMDDGSQGTVIIPDVDDSNDAQQEECEDTKEHIKPIIRSEGTKVYARKVIKTGQASASARSRLIGQVESGINLDNLGLTSDVVKDLPNEQYIDMRVGNVFYKVKKVTMKKSEFEAAAKEGNVEMKDGIILKKAVKVLLEPKKPITIESIIDESKSSVSKPIMKKTYVKKIPNVQDN